MASGPVEIAVRIKLTLSVWDAFKLRLAGPEVRQSVFDKVQVVIDRATTGPRVGRSIELGPLK